MIQDIRRNEMVTLHANILEITDSEAEEAIWFLEKEYKHELTDYPYVPPPFDKTAALWGAKVLYISAQLLLYRETDEEKLEKLFPAHPGPLSASAILSADLCLRFIPDILSQLKLIDDEDGLIPLLDEQMQTWHYSGIKYIGDYQEGTSFNVIHDNDCLRQLYINRVIRNNKTGLASHHMLKESVISGLGSLGNELWPGFMKSVRSEKE